MTNPPSNPKYFRPRNWDRFQHYKNRQPPWIKLHASLLRDYDFSQLTHRQQVVLMKLWLLYSQINRPLPLLAPWLGRQLHEDSNGVGKALPVLKSKGFIELCEKDASIALAPCKQSAILETETETETDNKVHSTPSASNGKSADDPFFDQFWQAFPRQRRGSKGKALAAWKTAVKRAMPDAILSGLKTYAASEEVARGYAKGAAAWLNDDRWASEYKPAGQGRLGPDGKPREVYLV